MFEYLELSDGTTTLELTDNVSYSLVSYAPQLGVLRDNELGGRGPYQDASDTIVVHVMGATAALAYAAADALNKMFDTARRWWLDGNATPVILRVKAQGSALSPLRAIVYGRPIGGPRPITLPPTFNESLCKYIFTGMTLQFTRGGQLLDNTVDTAASANATHPTIHTCTLSNAAVQSPIDLSLSGLTAASVGFYQTGYCLIAPVGRLSLVEGEATTNSAVGVGTAISSTQADAAAVASAGNVRRWTCAGFSGQIKNTWSIGGAIASSRQPIAVFAAVRFNSAVITSGTWQALGFHNGSVVDGTPKIPIALNSSLPQIISLGLLQSRAGFDQLSLFFEGFFSSGSVDIDYIAAISLDDEASRVIALSDAYAARMSSIAGATAVALEIRANALTDSAPAVRVTASGGIVEYFGYGGDPYLVQIGTDVSMILLTTGGTALWRPASGGAAISGVLTASRRLAYLAPQ